MVLLQICTDEDQGGNNSGASGSPSAPAMAQEVESREAENLEEDDDVEEEDDDIEEEDDHASWNGFLIELNALDEPLLISVFKQGKVCAHDTVMARLDVEFSKSHLFFSDLMSEARSSWEPLLHKAYGVKVAMNALFTGPAIVGARRQAAKKPEASVVPVATIPVKAGSTKAVSVKQNYGTTPVDLVSVKTVLANGAPEKDILTNVASLSTSQADSMSVGDTSANVVHVTTLPIKSLRPMPTITAQPKAVPAKAVSGNKGVYPVLKQGRPDFRNQQRGGVERQPFAFAREPLLDVSDETIWKKAAMVRRYFPGECREVRESV
jgi:hypothetical protein